MDTRASKSIPKHTLDLFLGGIGQIRQRVLVRLGPVVIGQVLIEASNSIKFIFFACNRRPFEFEKPIADAASSFVQFLAKDGCDSFLIPVSNFHQWFPPE